MKLIYIAGAGRSGSTILGIILGSDQKSIHVGEIGLALDWFDWGTSCSCGQPFAGCEFWNNWDWQSDEVQNGLKTAAKIEQFSHLPRLMLKRISAEDSAEYHKFHNNLFRYILDRSSKEIVVDSSKTTWSASGRFLALRKLAKLDVHVIHLVRNGYAVMESDLVTGDNRLLEGSHIRHHHLWGLRSIIGWGIFNLTVPLIGFFSSWRSGWKTKMVRIHYEDFVKKPAEEIQKIGQALDLDLEELAIRLRNPQQAFFSGHLVGGNRVRHQAQIQLKALNPRRYGEKLHFFHRFLFVILFGWLQLFYGYSLRIVPSLGPDHEHPLGWRFRNMMHYFAFKK